MHRDLHIVLQVLLVVGLAVVVLGCPSTGTDGGGSGTAGDDTIAEVSVIDPPVSGTRLPEISETVSHTVSYEISDEYFVPGNTYRITGYFRATDSLIQVFQTTVTEQSDSSVAVSFDIPAGFPVTSTTVVPYQLFFQLTDETNGILVLDDSLDLIYDDWIYTGTWYGIDSKSEMTNMGFQVWGYDTENNVYENGRKGTLENKAGNSAEMTFTHIWNGTSWEEPDPPEGGTIYYSLDGNRMTYAVDEGLTEVFQLLSTEPTTYDEDYAGDWWTGETKAPEYPDDNGIGLLMSDTEFSSIRSWEGQTEYPFIQRGTISASGNSLTLTVTHEASSENPDFFTPVDPNAQPVVYTMTYSYSAVDNELTLSGTSGGIYADLDGITYE